MRHIVYTPSIGTDSYTVVIANEPLESHHSIVGNPELYEISEDEIPVKHQYIDVPIPEIPQEVQLWRIRTILKLSQLETPIEDFLQTLPEPSKTAANYIWNYGTTVERGSQTIGLLQMVLQLTNEQVDDLFIQANQILL